MSGGRRSAAGSSAASLVVAVIVAVVVVTFFSVDLGRISVGGQSLKRVAEQQGTKFLKRPMHIEESARWSGTARSRSTTS